MFEIEYKTKLPMFEVTPEKTQYLGSSDKSPEHTMYCFIYLFGDNFEYRGSGIRKGGWFIYEDEEYKPIDDFEIQRMILRTFQTRGKWMKFLNVPYFGIKAIDVKRVEGVLKDYFFKTSE